MSQASIGIAPQVSRHGCRVLRMNPRKPSQRSARRRIATVTSGSIER